jgi:hypothetical protein
MQSIKVRSRVGSDGILHSNNQNKIMKFTLDVENNPTGWPDPNQTVLL